MAGRAMPPWSQFPRPPPDRPGTAVSSRPGQRGSPGDLSRPFPVCEHKGARRSHCRHNVPGQRPVAGHKSPLGGPALVPRPRALGVLPQNGAGRIWGWCHRPPPPPCVTLTDVSETARCPHCGAVVPDGDAPSGRAAYAGPGERGLGSLYQEIRRIREIAEARDGGEGGRRRGNSPARWKSSGPRWRGCAGRRRGPRSGPDGGAPRGAGPGPLRSRWPPGGRAAPRAVPRRRPTARTAAADRRLLPLRASAGRRPRRPWSAPPDGPAGWRGPACG